MEKLEFKKSDVYITAFLAKEALNEMLNKAKENNPDNISDEKTFEREYSPLLAIRDAYPKMIIARTHHETYDYQGVQVVDICRWLRE